MQKKKILFVCVENSCRSQMAEAFGRMHGQDAVDVYSAGSNPSGVVNPKAIESMQEIGYDLSQHRSEGLQDLPDADYDAAVTMGCGDRCPAIRARHRLDWDLPDPKNLPPEQFRQIRDEIEVRVKQLLSNLAEDD